MPCSALICSSPYIYQFRMRCPKDYPQRLVHLYQSDKPEARKSTCADHCSSLGGCRPSSTRQLAFSENPQGSRAPTVLIKPA